MVGLQVVKTNSKDDKMKAIETVYKSYRMRSRLEARWATFFDTLGIPWAYEQEGFDMDGEHYLPDFWLPQQQTWFEVKGQDLTEKEEEKCKRFASEKPLFVSVGSIPIPGEDDCNMIYKYTGDGREEGYRWAECPFCDTFGITRAGAWVSMSCNCWKECLNIQGFNKAIQKLNATDRVKLDFVANKLLNWSNTPCLIDAYTVARQARFEHGEKP